jgi:hypothetical protein
MQYRVDAYMKDGTVRQGAILHDNIDAAILLAKKVAHELRNCKYTMVARV